MKLLRHLQPLRAFDPAGGLTDAQIDHDLFAVLCQQAVCGELLISPESAIRHTHAPGTCASERFSPMCFLIRKVKW